jgi:hypothetical protein
MLSTKEYKSTTGEGGTCALRPVSVFLRTLVCKSFRIESRHVENKNDINLNNMIPSDDHRTANDISKRTCRGVVFNSHPVVDLYTSGHTLKPYHEHMSKHPQSS